MNIDITSLRLIRSSDSHIRIAMKTSKGEYEKYETFFCISQKEYHFIRPCLLGIAEVYPYFDDCAYLLKFTPYGMRVAYSSNKDMDYFNLPANELVPHLDIMFEDKEVKEIDLTHFISEWQKEYGPNVQVNVDDEVRERLLVDVKHPLLKEPGKDLVEDLVRWASQYSNGNLVSVNIQFDCCSDIRRNPEYPTSYYWWIWDEEQKVRIVNGGYIAHRYEKDDGSIQFQYSMHT